MQRAIERVVYQSEDFQGNNAQQRLIARFTKNHWRMRFLTG